MAELTAKNQRQRFMMVGGSTGAILVFVATGMLADVFKVIIGAGLGAGVAVLVWAYAARNARERAAEDLLDLTKKDLERQARSLQIKNPSKKTKAELAEEIVAHSDNTDATGELLIETVEVLHEKVNGTVEQAREKLASRDGQAL